MSKKKTEEYTTKRVIPGTALCSQDSTQRSSTQHRSEWNGAAPHGSAKSLSGNAFATCLVLFFRAFFSVTF